MKKIGLLSLALVLALGALGVGYAAWTDTITIEGTVNTGSVDLQVVELSSTLIYKVPDAPGEIVVVKQKENLRDLGGGIGWHIVNVPPIPDNGILVAQAKTTSPEDDEIVITVDNAFPCQDLTADFLIHYVGSVPAKVDVELTGCEDLTPDNGINDCDVLAPYVEVHFYESDENGTIGQEITECPVQMHYCDYVYCVATLHLPQDNSLMNLGCSFTAKITAIQWNEYGEEIP